MLGLPLLANMEFWELDFPFCLTHNNKGDTIYEALVSKTLDIRQ